MLAKYHKMLCLSPLLLLDEVEKLSESLEKLLQSLLSFQSLLWHILVWSVPSEPTLKVPKLFSEVLTVFSPPCKKVGAVMPHKNDLHVVRSGDKELTADLFWYTLWTI